jgi:hypothetical protein
VKYLQGLLGHYALTVVKQDKSENEFDIDVGGTNVTLLRSPQHPFIQVSTDVVSAS